MTTSWWDKPHEFKPKIFQGREQLACEICGRIKEAPVHQGPRAPEGDSSEHTG